MADSCTPRSSSFTIANILSDDIKGVVKKRRIEDENEVTAHRRGSEQDKKAKLSAFSDNGRSPFLQPYHTYFPALIGRLDERNNHYPITAGNPGFLVRQIPATSSHVEHTKNVKCKAKVKSFESERNDFAKDYSERTASDCESDEGADTNISLSVPGDNNDNIESNVTKVKKKTRTVFSRHQIFYLESAFDTKRYLSSTERAEIASALNLTETQVKVWFQNRRNKWKSQVSGSDNGIPTERYPGMLLGASQYPLSVAASNSALQFYRRPMFYF